MPIREKWFTCVRWFFPQYRDQADLDMVPWYETSIFTRQKPKQKLKEGSAPADKTTLKRLTNWSCYQLLPQGFTLNNIEISRLNLSFTHEKNLLHGCNLTTYRTVCEEMVAWGSSVTRNSNLELNKVMKILRWVDVFPGLDSCTWLIPLWPQTNSALLCRSLPSFPI